MPPDGPPFPLPPPRRPTICAHPMHMLPLSLDNCSGPLPASECLCVCVFKFVGLEIHNGLLGYPEEGKTQEEWRTQYAALKIKKSTSISQANYQSGCILGKSNNHKKPKLPQGVRAERRRHKLHTPTKPAILGCLFFSRAAFCIVILCHKTGR